MSDELYRAAQPRRLYHHVLNGGTLKPHDVAGMVEVIEGLEANLTAAQEENERLRVLLNSVLSVYEALGTRGTVHEMARAALNGLPR